MTTWAYIIATVGFLFGGYLILKHKKWKIGGWVVCLSLAIFTAANINIHNLIEVDDAFKFQTTQQVSAISNTVAQIKVQMNQSMVFTQQISQTVNLVTEIKKEIADMKTIIADLYSRTRIEQIMAAKSDRVQYISKADGSRLFGILLNDTPIPESISAMMYSPGEPQTVLKPYPHHGLRNFIGYILANSPANPSNIEFCITYVADPNETNSYRTISVKGDAFLLDGQVNVRIQGAP